MLAIGKKGEVTASLGRRHHWWPSVDDNNRFACPQGQNRPLGFLAFFLEESVGLCSLSVLGCQYFTRTAVPQVLMLAGLPCLTLGNQFVTSFWVQPLLLESGTPKCLCYECQVPMVPMSAWISNKRVLYKVIAHWSEKERYLCITVCWYYCGLWRFCLKKLGSRIGLKIYNEMLISIRFWLTLTWLSDGIFNSQFYKL